MRFSGKRNGTPFFTSKSTIAAVELPPFDIATTILYRSDYKVSTFPFFYLLLSYKLIFFLFYFSIQMYEKPGWDGCPHRVLD
jgi:hypothetical protein